jgi:hypothetical protein
VREVGKDKIFTDYIEASNKMTTLLLKKKKRRDSKMAARGRKQKATLL